MSNKCTLLSTTWTQDYCLLLKLMTLIGFYLDPKSKEKKCFQRVLAASIVITMHIVLTVGLCNSVDYFLQANTFRKASTSLTVSVVLNIWLWHASFRKRHEMRRISDVNEKDKSFRNEIYMYVFKNRARNIPNESALDIIAFRNESIAFSASGYFSFTKGFILTVIGVLLTYSLLLNQLQTQ
ncbi:hypothetical protein TNIN_354991 [Trichonephila inaurata madagascariensis]|uniref:Uncharacterized protein n=1 Tax=Trichonephila inaurata madagascariensis TaxID=2747483 RepID=A0A8X6XXE5_9ARAC|nr:hypothetical protein TNIN_354991 [Trichonephila inaurata madagascariensis]